MQEFVCFVEISRNLNVQSMKWKQVCLNYSCCSDEGKLMAEGLHLLLSLNLARGHVAALVRTIKHLYGKSQRSIIEFVLPV